MSGDEGWSTLEVRKNYNLATARDFCELLQVTGDNDYDRKILGLINVVKTTLGLSGPKSEGVSPGADTLAKQDCPIIPKTFVVTYPDGSFHTFVRKPEEPK